MPEQYRVEPSEATCDRCFSSLTDAERSCLELVAEDYLAKEIARQRHISVHSVNKIVRELRRRLGPLPTGGAVTRQDLARSYRAWKARKNSMPSESRRIGPYSSPLSQADHSGSDHVPAHHTDGLLAPGVSHAKDQEPYLSQKKVAALLDLVPLPTTERPHNDMSWQSALVACAIIACMTMIAAGSTTSFLAAIASLVRE